MNLGATCKRYFCELHFRESDIRRQFHRSTLRRDAVPISHPGGAASMESQETIDILQESVVQNSGNIMSTSDRSDSYQCSFFSELEETLKLHEDMRDIEGSSQLSAPDDLIYTDLEGSSHINSSVCDASESLLGIEYDVVEEPVQNHSSIVSDLMDPVSKTDADRALSTSPLASNVIFQVASFFGPPDEFTQQNRVHSTINEAHQISSKSKIEPPYPARRALQRRQQRLRFLMSRRPRKPRIEIPKNSAPSASVRSQPAGAAISLEEVAGRTEDTYFALSLVGSLERLNTKKRAIAKLHILQYLTELAFAED